VAERGRSPRTRVEVAFEGGQTLSVLVDHGVAEALEQALGEGDEAAFALDADDGHYTVALRRVVYVKRFARETSVGFLGR
jgi:hypothetical protein